jgi:hypothetical protein
MRINSNDPNLPASVKAAIAADDAARKLRVTSEAVLEGVDANRGKRRRLNAPPFNGGNKYHAQPVVIDGHRFPSTAEGDYYCKLKLLMQAGEVAWFAVQPRFIIEGGEYVADFIVAYNRPADLAMGLRTISHVTVEDVKGYKTDLYERSKKQVKARYGIEIVEIRDGGPR